ncbi:MULTISPECIES: BrnA antitoxin family protein [Methylobacterium]|jgi:uncharacterized protein (DUF4415 family)|uniref:Antitoxin n=1 Tax=Methylobacterium hispanicum TaxID=270350 RepID=A0AAV5A0R9_9HYPH|nr:MULTISPECIES: BrnA antitoxin family protein [Methylobacterium]GJD92640.1 hypothetical protein BHAOGJBA_6196 [Methylobacterium hispanicum]
MPKPDLDLPPISDAEEARIQAGIAADPDNPELTEADFALARPLAETQPELLRRILQARERAVAQEKVSLNIDRDILDRFRATGLGWQARLNAALRRAAEDLPAA